MAIETLINTKTLTTNKWLSFMLPAVATGLIVFANYYVFIVVPNEQVMGAVQRVFYYHVGSAMISYLFLGVLLFASSFYLATKKIEWDVLANASAEVAFLLCTIVLVSGMIWGHSAWNTWWRWEPRLVSFLVLWLILFSYYMLREFAAGHPMERNFSAVLGIISAINVPIVIFSIKLLEHSEQLHPEVVASQGLKDARFVYGLLITTAAVLFFGLWLFKTSVVEKLLQGQVSRQVSERD